VYAFGAVIANLDGSNSLVNYFLRGDAVDEVFAQQAGTGAQSWLLTDRQGTVHDMIGTMNGLNPLLDHLDYDPFGNILNEASPGAGLVFAWTGRERDAATGLQFNNARYYDPKTGRWTTQDPLGFGAGDSNLYRYVGNGPTNDTDPSGLQASGPQAQTTTQTYGGIGGNGGYGAGGGGGFAGGGSTPGNPGSGFSGISGNGSLGGGSFPTLPSGVDRPPWVIAAERERRLQAEAIAAALEQTRRKEAAAHDLAFQEYKKVLDGAMSRGQTPGEALMAMLTQVQDGKLRAPYFEVEGLILDYLTKRQIGLQRAAQSAAAQFERNQKSISPSPDSYDGRIYAAQLKREARQRAIDNGVSPFMLWLEDTFGPGGTWDQVAVAGVPLMAGVAGVGPGSALLSPRSRVSPNKVAHGNSLDYIGDTHVYRIKGPNGTYKIGESMQGVRNTDGASMRAEEQVRKFQRETGDFYSSDIRKTFPDKRAAREYETKLIDRFRRLFGDDSLPGNKTNR
jgi:RHS repeat-associated protein